jgi:hypothetical protein
MLTLLTLIRPYSTVRSHTIRSRTRPTPTGSRYDPCRQPPTLRERGVSVSLSPDGKLWLQPKVCADPDLLAAAKAHQAGI